MQFVTACLGSTAHAVTDALFGACAAISVLGSILVVTRRNPIYSALFLILTFISIAVIFALLKATFLAGLHVLVYTGAIMVLFLFVIMLLSLKPDEFGGEYSFARRLGVVLLCAGLFAVLAFAFSVEPGLERGLQEPDPKFGTADQVGRSLFDQYILPFELISILITVAILGGVVLAKRKLQ